MEIDITPQPNHMSDLLHKCQSAQWAVACIAGLEGEIAALKSDVDNYMAIATGEMNGRIELQPALSGWRAS